MPKPIYGLPAYKALPRKFGRLVAHRPDTKARTYWTGPSYGMDDLRLLSCGDAHPAVGGAPNGEIGLTVWDTSGCGSKRDRRERGAPDSKRHPRLKPLVIERIDRW